MTTRKWTAEQHLQFLKLHLRADGQWLATGPFAALAARHEELASDKWMYVSVRNISEWRAENARPTSAPAPPVAIAHETVERDLAEAEVARCSQIGAAIARCLTDMSVVCMAAESGMREGIAIGRAESRTAEQGEEREVFKRYAGANGMDLTEKMNGAFQHPATEAALEVWNARASLDRRLADTPPTVAAATRAAFLKAAQIFEAHMDMRAHANINIRKGLKAVHALADALPAEAPEGWETEDITELRAVVALLTKTFRRCVRDLAHAASLSPQHQVFRERAEHYQSILVDTNQYHRTEYEEVAFAIEVRELLGTFMRDDAIPRLKELLRLAASTEVPEGRETVAALQKIERYVNTRTSATTEQLGFIADMCHKALGVITASPETPEEQETLRSIGFVDEFLAPDGTSVFDKRVYPRQAAGMREVFVVAASSEAEAEETPDDSLCRVLVVALRGLITKIEALPDDIEGYFDDEFAQAMLAASAAVVAAETGASPEAPCEHVWSQIPTEGTDASNYLTCIGCGLRQYPPSHPIWNAAQPAAPNGLGSLLALIHRDGGQYVEEHGTEEAIHDAIVKLERQWLTIVQGLDNAPIVGAQLAASERVASMLGELVENVLAKHGINIQGDVRSVTRSHSALAQATPQAPEEE